MFFSPAVYPYAKIMPCKFEKVPRNIQDEKSRKDTVSSESWSQQLEHKQVPKTIDGTRCPKA